MTSICPRDVIAEAIQYTPDGRHAIYLSVPDQQRRKIAEHALDALAGEGYSVVPTAEWERLSVKEIGSHENAV